MRFGDKIKINKDIKDFRGGILNLGGGDSDIWRMEQRYQVATPKLKMYTVNNDSTENPDLHANFCSEKALKCLPDNRFDIVYFSKVSFYQSEGSKEKSKFEIAIKNAYRVLKPDGILIIAGQGASPYLNNRGDYNPGIDIPGFLAKAGFQFGKLIPESHSRAYSKGLEERGTYVEPSAKSTEFLSNENWYYACPNGNQMVAGKTRTIDLVNHCKKNDMLPAIMMDSFGIEFSSFMKIMSVDTTHTDFKDIEKNKEQSAGQYPAHSSKPSWTKNLEPRSEEEIHQDKTKILDTSTQLRM